MNLARFVGPQVIKMLETVIIVVHLLVALVIVGLVLMQQGKGAEAGASFGAGASGTVFGSQGSGTFFSRLTAIMAAIFFATSLGLAFYAKQQAQAIDTLGLPVMMDAQTESLVLPQEAEQEVKKDAGAIPQLD